MSGHEHGEQDRTEQDRRATPQQQGHQQQGGQAEGAQQRQRADQGQPNQGRHQQAQPQQSQPQGGYQQGGAPGQPGRHQGGHGGGIDVGGLPWTSGILNGALTFVAGYIAIAIVLFADVFMTASGSSMGGPTAGAAAPGLDGEALFYVIGWVFFNAHFVDIAAAGESVNLLSVFGGFTTIPTLVYYAVPALLLVATGRNVAKKTRSGASDGERAAAGVTVLAGYLPLAVAGSVVLTLEVGALGTTGSIGPDTGSALLFAGIAYPLVFGGIGGYLSD